MLLKIDELSREDHFHLTDQDQCFYIREYTAEGFQTGSDNQLVFNLKCPIDHDNEGRLYYKRRAIDTAKADIVQALAGSSLVNAIFIPIPPSKRVGHPKHDPRVRQMLSAAERTYNLSVVEEIVNTQDRDAVHESDHRLTVQEARANLQLVTAEKLHGRPIVLFDDVLVSGCQFRAAEQLLHEYVPNAEVFGLFWVRRIFP